MDFFCHSHTNTQDGSTGTGSSLPPYLEMAYASIDSDGVGEANSVLIVSALDDTFPRGAASYGGTGGSEAHTHEVTITTRELTSLQF